MELAVPPYRTILACATVMEELQPLLTPDVTTRMLDFGLHVDPAKLKAALQTAIDEAAQSFDEVVLGYGLCSLAVVGLRANGCTLVVPRVDDCISIFLGSREEYRRQTRSQPGTYYLTKGWIEVGDTPFSEYDRLVAKYGEQRAERIIRLSIKHYTRLALIDTGRGDDMEPYRTFARNLAERWDLRFEEVQGSNTLVRKMLFGPWDADFVVIPPGGVIQYRDFYPDAAPRPEQSQGV
jgi:hypothetical protein